MLSGGSAGVRVFTVASPRSPSASGSTPPSSRSSTRSCFGRSRSTLRPARRRLHLGHRRQSVRDHLVSGSSRLQDPQRRVHRPAGVQPGNRRGHAHRPISSRDGRERHRQLLPTARCSSRGRPHAAARRRSSRRPSRGGDLYRLWRREFGGESVGAVGRRIRIHGQRTQSSASRRRSSPAWCG